MFNDYKPNGGQVDEKTMKTNDKQFHFEISDGYSYHGCLPDIEFKEINYYAYFIIIRNWWFSYIMRSKQTQPVYYISLNLQMTMKVNPDY